MKKENNNGFDMHSVLAVFGFGCPIFIMLAPKEFRRDLLEYIGHWIVFWIVIAIVWFVWSISVKDKIAEKRRRKEQDAFEEWQKKYGNNKRED